MIIEVLSESTEKTDRTIKLEKYKQIEALKEYVLIEQNEPRFEIFRHSTDGWLVESSTEKIELASLACSPAAQDVYEGGRFG